MRAVLVLLILAAATARAAPPDGADPESPLGKWFGGLTQPGTGMSCCSIADCRAEPYRQIADGYEVFIDAEWIKVPHDLVLQQIDNPTGRAITCHIAKTIYCFVRETES